MLNKDERRLNDILDILKIKKSATVNYLAEKVYTSPSTIRRDLSILESRGLVQRFHGGASMSGSPTASLPIEYRVQDMAEAKKQIGLIAAKLIQDGDTIFIDSSSTAATIVPHLAQFRRLKVITNSMVSLQPLHELQCEVYGVGGRLFHNSNAFVGQYAMETLSHFHIDKMFFSTASLSSAGTLYDTTEGENQLRQCAMKRSDQIYGLIDSSKIGRSSLLELCHLRDLTGVISDANLPETISWNEDYPKFYRA